MYLTDLATAVRKSGLPVKEVDGWRSRGHGEMRGVRTIACHHTAGPATGNYPSLRVVRDGRPGLVGPLSHLGLGRDGTVYVIAAGLCWHTGATRTADESNPYAIGIEAEHTGTGAWPSAQYDAYVRLCAALCEHYDLDADRVLAHKEIAVPAGRKVDPNYPMPPFRAAVAELLKGDDMANYAEQLDNIEALVRKAIVEQREGRKAVGLLLRKVGANLDANDQKIIDALINGE